MRVLLVVNPTASAVTADNRAAVESALREDHEVTVAETAERSHGQVLAQDAATAGTDAVVVLAGDGTLNEVANGLVGTPASLGVLPGGSTNVFARTIGMGRRIGPATEQLRAAMAARSLRRIGLGVVNERHFLFHVGIGFDAAVVEQVEQLERRLPLKRVLGQVVFASCAVSTWLCRYGRGRPPFTIRFGDEEPPVETPFAICLNTDPYTFVGSRAVTIDPGATLDSPLSGLAFGDLTLGTLGRALAASLSGNSPVREGGHVVLRSGVQALTITGPGGRPVPWQLDGDLGGHDARLVISHRPACLDVLVPTGPTTAPR